METRLVITRREKADNFDQHIIEREKTTGTKAMKF